MGRRVLQPDELGSVMCCCVTWGKLLSLSGPHSPYLYNWDNNKNINLHLQSQCLTHMVNAKKKKSLFLITAMKYHIVIKMVKQYIRILAI